MTMERRTVLKVLSGAAAGGVLGCYPRAWGQAPARSLDPRAGAPAFNTAPGVNSKDIRIGMSAAFKGPSASLGIELFRGAQAYYADINLRGGVHGRTISVVALDDGYEPTPCIRNTIELIEREQVFFLSNYVGTPTLTRALPVIKRYADRQVILVGNFTGAQPQREEPYLDQVFNIRASYRQEMMALVDRFWQAGVRKFGVYYQIDAYGRSGTDGVARGLAQHGARIAAEATYVRGARFEDDMSPAVPASKRCSAPAPIRAAARSSGPHAISAGPCRSPTCRSWAPRRC
jgi:ABC-type branched-subunit amino acid transport system substrate-binding protein